MRCPEKLHLTFRDNAFYQLSKKPVIQAYLKILYTFFRFSEMVLLFMSGRAQKPILSI